MSTQHADDNQSDAPAYKDSETLRRLYWDEGLNGEEVADKLGCSPASVYNWMDKLGIERREKAKPWTGSNGFDHVPCYVSEGYRFWKHSYNGDCDRVLVSRLMAVAEYGFDETVGNIVHHKNGIRWDNRSENIELMGWGEHSSHHKQGENHHDSKLSESEVIEMKYMYENTDMTQAEVGERFGVGQSVVSNIHHGNSWSHLFNSPND